jgi:sugar diacid utilization regulator
VSDEPPSTASQPDLVDEDGGSWSSQLQAIVDEASRVLGRPVAIDDRHRRLVAYTQHGEEDVDRVRLMSIMKQRLPVEAIEWVRRHGSWASERPFRVPPNQSLEYDARVAAPLRCQGHGLGLMWCTDRDQTMTDADLERMAAFADEAAVVLYRETLLQDLNRSRERELLRDVLSGDDDVRREAAWRLAELDLFTSSGRVAVLVIPLADAGDDRSQENARVAVETVVMRIRRHVAPKHGLHLLRPSHALILVSLADPGIRAKGLRAFAAQVHEEFVAAGLRAEHGARQIVAVGGAVRAITDAATSYEQALRAANTASTVSSLGDVVCWEDLGIYQMLTEMPIDVFGPKALHPGVRALLQTPRSRELLRTLERYLDLAGDIQATATSLYLHRTTLWHRLRRIEHLANVDLRRGDDRLALHLSLKIARLQGVTWSTDDESDAAIDALGG